MKKNLQVLVLLLLSYTGYSQTYCTPGSSCNSGDRIDTLIINNYKYATNPLCSPNGYNYFPNTAISFRQGVSYNFTLKLQPTSYSEGIAIFLDTNKDGDFDDTGEKIYNPSTMVQGINGPVNFMVLIPMNTVLGKVRMRIRVIYSTTTINSCSSYSYGETEDYEVNILPGIQPIGDELIIQQTTITTDSTFEANKSIKTQNNAIFNTNQKKVFLTTEESIELKPGTTIDYRTTFLGFISKPGKEESSAGTLTLKDSIEYKFNSMSTPLKFELTGATFSNVLGDFSLTLNNAEIPLTNLNTTLTNNLVTITTPLINGANTIVFMGKDILGKPLFKEAEIWAGPHSLQITVYDINNNLVTNAEVSILISGNDKIRKTLFSGSNGQVLFQNLPRQTILANARIGTTYNSLGVAVSGANAISLKLLPIGTPSPIDNNDFSQQLNGWETGSSPVQLVPHDEDPGPNFTNGANVVDMDMQVGTSGQGPQSSVRTFTIQPGTKKVDIRYRFVTTEVPNGYFGSIFNDYFSIRLRSMVTGNALEINSSQNIASEENDMNGLGLGAFYYSTGATQWRNVSLVTSGDGDVVKVEAIVANVADGLFDSRLEIDIVTQGKLAIESTDLEDKNVVMGTYDPLIYLSMDLPNPYNDHNTTVWGKNIVIKGATNDALTDLQIHVIKNGLTVATGSLTPEARTELLKPFGSTGKIERKTSIKLFDIPSTHIGDVNSTLTLKLEATSQLNETAMYNYKKSVGLMNRFQGDEARRYSEDRDLNQGGDDWAHPNVITWLNSLPAHWQFNDISDMNAHNFQDDHTSGHRNGTNIDVRFTGYREYETIAGKIQDALITKKATAIEIVNFLNTPTGLNNISKIFVDYNTTSEFATYINTTKLTNGQFANTIIKKLANHRNHFHIEVKANAAVPTANALISKRENLSNQISAINANYTASSPIEVNFRENDNIQNIFIKSEQKGVYNAEFYDFEGVKQFEMSTDMAGETKVISVEKSKFLRTGAYFVKINTPSGQSYASSFTVF